MEIFVARQPIFDTHQNLFAYELLFRSGLENYFDLKDGDQATSDVIMNSIFFIGLKQLTGGKKAAINFTENLLLDGIPSLFPADQIIVEILETVTPEEEVVAVCRTLKQEGYIIALDDFVMQDHQSPLIEFADIIKVDFGETTDAERQAIPKRLATSDVKFLAEKVETLEEFKQARAWGYTLFQGYFFSKPVISTGRSIPSSKLSHLQILRQISQPNIEFDEMENTIKRDMAMTYKLLRLINSAYFGIAVEIKSVKQALVLLGMKEIKKWVSLLALEQLGADKPQELIAHSVIRAKFCENIAMTAGRDHQASEMFLTGMFTVLDAIMDIPMADVLEELPLSEDIKQALLGKPNDYRRILDLVLAYEAGDWKGFAERAAGLSIDESEVPDSYNESVEWADLILRDVEAPDNSE